MNNEPGETREVELFAASLRADATDIEAFLEALASKLSGSLPMQTSVVRHSALFSREHPVKEITVSLGEYQYRIGRERKGPLVAYRTKVVRGIVIKTDPVSVEEWIEELAAALAQYAAQSAQARIALERFLL